MDAHKNKDFGKKENRTKAAVRRQIGCTLLTKVVLNLKRYGRFPDL